MADDRRLTIGKIRKVSGLLFAEIRSRIGSSEIAGIAQLVERNLAKVEATSSNLVTRSNFTAHQTLIVPHTISRLVTTLILLAALLGSASGRAEIEITGLGGELRDAVRTGLTFPAGCDQPTWMMRFRFRGAEREVRQALETYGYYNATVDTTLDETGACPVARIAISAGPRTVYRDVSIRIKGDEGLFAPVIRSSAPTPGSPLDHAAYENFKSALQEVAARFGFLEATFVQTEIVVDAQDNTARLNLTFDTGPRYVFGDIIYPNSLLREQVLARYHPFESGTPYDTEKLEELYFGLVESGYFEDVVIRPLEPLGTAIPISIELIAGKKRTRRAGVGASTDYGPNVSYSQENRLVNDRGHQTSFSISLSPVISSAGMGYRIPHATERDGWYTVYGGIEREDTTSSVSTTSTVGTRRISPRSGGWVETIYFEIVNDRFEIADIVDTTTHYIPGIRYTQTKSSSATTRTRRGHRLDAELLGASRKFGSTTDLTTLRLEARFIRTLVGDLRVLGRARTGITETDDFDRLPPRARFFSGGDARLRGYDLDAIGILDADERVIGGDRLLEYSVELDHSIGENWALAAFTDAASVSRDSFSTDFTRSVGIGIRWYSPVGPIRVDIGKPLDGDRGLRLHLSLGPEI